MIDPRGGMGVAAQAGDVATKEDGAEHGAGLIGWVTGSIGGGGEEEVEQTGDTIGEGQRGEMTFGLRAGRVLSPARRGEEGIEQLGGDRHIRICIVVFVGVSMEEGERCLPCCPSPFSLQ